MSSKEYLKQQEKIRAFPEVAEGDIILASWGDAINCAEKYGFASKAKKTGPSGAVKKLYIVPAEKAEEFRRVFAKWEEARKKKEAERDAEMFRRMDRERIEHKENEKRRAQPLDDDTEVSCNCRICEFSRPRDFYTWECRHSPPCAEGFPVIELCWWCGEWERKEVATVGDAEDAKRCSEEEIDRWERMER